MLDQILDSEEFLPNGRNSVGDVRRVDYFNDHLHEGRDRTRSDHGFVRALLRLKLPSPPPAQSASMPPADATMPSDLPRSSLSQPRPLRVCNGMYADTAWR